MSYPMTSMSLRNYVRQERVTLAGRCGHLHGEHVGGAEPHPYCSQQTGESSLTDFLLFPFVIPSPLDCRAVPPMFRVGLLPFNQYALENSSQTQPEVCFALDGHSPTNELIKVNHNTRQAQPCLSPQSCAFLIYCLLATPRSPSPPL